MHDKSYPLVSYRLNEKTKNKIKMLHKEMGLSYNLLFVDMIKRYIRKMARNGKKIAEELSEELPF